MTPTDLAEALHRAFTQAPPLFSTEAELQELIGKLLHDCLPVTHGLLKEVRLSARDRPDFLVRPYTPYESAPGVAIEVKIGGSLSDLTRQLARYAESERVTGLVVVTTKAQHCRLPPTLSGKPIAVVSLVDFTLGF